MIWVFCLLDMTVSQGQRAQSLIAIVGGWVSELRDMLYSTHRWAQQTAPKGCSLLSNPQHIRAIHNLEPEYIADMITEYTPGRQLHSAGSRPLRVPRHNLERYGRRGYSVTAPRLWNDLPDSLHLIYSHELIALHPLIRIRIMSHPDMG
jgi:hypothetical protein